MSNTPENEANQANSTEKQDTAIQKHKPHACRKKTKFHSITLFLFAAVLIVGGMAVAAPKAAKHFFSPERIKAHIDERVEETLTEIGATDEQRQEVQALKTDLMNTFTQFHKDHFKNHELLLEQWRSDTPDRELIDNLMAEHMQAKKALADKVADAVFELHDILTHEQREQLADKIEAHVQEAHRFFEKN